MADALASLSTPPALAPEALNVEAARPEAKPPSTPGKKAHWALTYLGGDWLLNSTCGVAFTYFASRSALGKRIYFEPVTNLFRNIFKPLIKNPETLEKSIGGGRDFLSIMFGGTVINPVLTYLESHEQKKSISKFFDTMIYGKERVENDPKFQEAYDAIDREPKKDTKSVWISRFIALSPLIASSFIPEARKFLASNDVPILKHISYDRISAFSQKTAEKIGIRPKKMMERMAVDSTTGEVKSDWKALHDYIGFDFGATIYYAILHAAAFSGVAQLRQTHRDNKAERKAAEVGTTTKPLPMTSRETAIAEEPETLSLPDKEGIGSGIPKPKVRDVTREENISQHAGAQIA